MSYNLVVYLIQPCTFAIKLMSPQNEDVSTYIIIVFKYVR